MNGLFTEQVKPVKGLSPSADLYNGDPATDIFNMENYDKICFVLHQADGGGTTGKATITVEACDDVSATHKSAIAFKYRKMTTGASDVMGAVTAATASGFTTTANEDTVYFIEVSAADLPSGYPFVRMQLTESVNDPVSGSVLAYLMGARYKEPNMPSALS